MTAESRRVHLRVGSDPRLLPAVTAAVAWISEEAGLESAAQADFAAAAEEACRETFPLLPQSPAVLDITVEKLADRVEVTLEHHGKAAPAAGLGSTVQGGQGLTGGAHDLSLLSRVDRVQYSSEGGASKTTLIKYLSTPDSGTP